MIQVQICLSVFKVYIKVCKLRNCEAGYRITAELRGKRRYKPSVSNKEDREEHKKTEIVIDTENQQVVTRGEGIEGKKEIGEGP